jgi:hypothetical protein
LSKPRDVREFEIRDRYKESIRRISLSQRWNVKVAAP